MYLHAIGFLLIVCSWLISFELLPIFQKLSNWFPITYPWSPFQWLCHPNPCLWFLTSLMRFFSQYEFPNMFRRLRSMLPRIFKLLSFCLIGFWMCLLFNYPLTFTLTFPILKWMDWHGTKGVPSLVSHEPMFQILDQYI